MLLWLRGPRDAPALLQLVWPMYLLHQFEEHGIDFRGRHFAFLGDLCAQLGHAVDNCPADAPFVFAVNVVGCQIAFATAWFTARRAPLVAACVWGIPLVNIFAHVVAAIRDRSYNAGLVSSLVLFAPLSFVTLRANLSRPTQLVAVVVSGLTVHAILIASVFLHQFGHLGEPAFLAVNCINGLVPLAIAACARGTGRAIPQ
jgi:hypothetical protein